MRRAKGGRQASDAASGRPKMVSAPMRERSACVVRDLNVIGLGRRALHLLDDQVHPDEGCAGDDRHEDEGRRDQTRPLLDVGKQRGQEESAKTAEHADEAAHRAHMVGEVGGDVLVDGSLADAH